MDEYERVNRLAKREAILEVLDCLLQEVCGKRLEDFHPSVRMRVTHKLRDIGVYR